MILLALAGLLAGCVNAEIQDLQNFINDVKSRRPARIDPLPEVKTFESFYYQAQELRDPFSQAVSEVAEEQAPVSGGGGTGPDTIRRREPLESFSLQELAMVAMLTLQDKTWAAVLAPDGTVHRLQVGNYLGRNHGRVVRITETAVEMREIVPDGAGGWEERDNVLAMTLR
jgi:type IV pilus assembly protein PilP